MTEAVVRQRKGPTNSEMCGHKTDTTSCCAGERLNAFESHLSLCFVASSPFGVVSRLAPRVNPVPWQHGLVFHLVVFVTLM